MLEAGKGQQMNVSIATDNPSSYFNVLAPGENEVAMFVGAAGDLLIRMSMILAFQQA